MGFLRLLGDARAWSLWRPQTVSRLARYFQADPVSRDVVLFEHNRPRFFRLLGLFCVGQAGFWAYMAHFGYTSLRDIRQSGSGEEKEVKGRNMGSPLWRATFTLSCLSVGSLVMAAGLLFSRRSVSAVTLHAGADRVTIATAGVFGLGSSFTVPLRHISCMAHRAQVPAMVPLKVKGRPLYYLLDKQGRVSNGKLFDLTVGAYRTL
ncbi:transmembrane protein 223 [Hyla sarda]|uniref:transmembrane protein 223 n=1 Tax=Hyla sarda TaxID=327740 RepID=UPI0024C37EBE|nr:transmembrane protein 223 [Hyla sarda]XP_056383538.1 transmembrane protein 223 [Hyla sarda]